MINKLIQNYEYFVLMKFYKFTGINAIGVKMTGSNTNGESITGASRRGERMTGTNNHGERMTFLQKIEFI